MIKKVKLAPGLFYLEVPGAGLNILCGSPMDSVKHLQQRGLIRTTVKNGVEWETGPNAILLSDLPMQNGQFWNLSEFPVLHMLYKQGMALPGHPGNNGTRPLLLGSREQLEAQGRYIFRGTYGLASPEELTDAGLLPEEVAWMWRLKRRFHYDNIKDTSELLDLVPVPEDWTPVRPGLDVRRAGLNRYEFRGEKDTETVDLNLKDEDRLLPSYNLGFHKIDREYFSVIHTGEGNGWDKDRPCMSSIITFQGKIYLIDAGPNILATLTSLGISVNEIEGIFHTHAHDDHFSGLISLIRSDRKLKYFAARPVRESVKKKMCALLGREEEMFDRIFEIRDLTAGVWNDIHGLEVKPVWSPHPVETTILYFRTVWEDGFRSYAHLADIVSDRVLKSFITTKSDKPGITKTLYSKVIEDYHEPADIKKIDAGGGLVHGDAIDFQDDPSGKIILSHTTGEISDTEKETGSTATFGMQEVLIDSARDYYLDQGRDFLASYFPDARRWSVELLLNCPLAETQPGTILVRKGEVNRHVFLIVSGFAEYIRTEQNINNVLTAGSLIGEVSGLLQKPVRGTIRTGCYCRILTIPVDIFREFASRNGLDEPIIKIHGVRSFLQNTRLFGSMLSYQTRDRICRSLTTRTVKSGEVITPGKTKSLFMIHTGRGALAVDGKKVAPLGPGDPFCIEDALSLLKNKSTRFSAVFSSAAELYVLPASCLTDIPVIQISLLELYENRLRLLVKD
jgi:hemerythrin